MAAIMTLRYVSVTWQVHLTLESINFSNYLVLFIFLITELVIGQQEKPFYFFTAFMSFFIRKSLTKQKLII